MNEDLILVVDSDVELPKLNQLESIAQTLVEHSLYQHFGDTKLYYRIDKGNNAPGQQRHIHVSKDNKGRIQLFAVNFDGTKHDGSHRQLSRDEQLALIRLGIPVPSNGLLEYENLNKGKMLLLD